MNARDLVKGQDDWEVVKRFLPVDWVEQAKPCGALRRLRGFASAEMLLRVLLIHLAEGISARETVVRARLGGFAQVSDVALLKRLKGSGEWLRWMAEQVMTNWLLVKPAAVFGGGMTVRVLDATTVQEPGVTGSMWRLHYSVRLPSLQCDEVHVTGRGTGESFKRFAVKAGELIVADRGYAHPEGIAEVLKAGGHVLVRINLTNVPLRSPSGAVMKPLTRLRRLRSGQVGEWDVRLPLAQGLVPARLCAVKLSAQAATKARKKAMVDNNRRGHQILPETLEACGFVMVLTTLAQSQMSAINVLEIYRGRWQVELAFKRLKSLLRLGHLKKTDPEAARAWLHGKLLVAFLIEALIAAGHFFSPWGYPFQTPSSAQSVARNKFHASSAPVRH